MKKFFTLCLTLILGIAFCGGVVSKPVEKNHKLEIVKDCNFDAVTVAALECVKCDVINCTLSHYRTAGLVNDNFSAVNSVDLFDPGKINKKMKRFKFIREFYYTKNKYSKKMYCHFSPYHYLKVNAALYNDGSGSTENI